MGNSKPVDSGIAVDDLRAIYLLMNRRMLLAALEALQPAPELLEMRGLIERFADFGRGLKELGLVAATLTEAVNALDGRPAQTVRQTIEFLRKRCSEAEARLRVLGVTVTYGNAVLS